MDIELGQLQVTRLAENAIRIVDSALKRKIELKKVSTLVDYHPGNDAGGPEEIAEADLLYENTVGYRTFKYFVYLVLNKDIHGDYAKNQMRIDTICEVYEASNLIRTKELSAQIPMRTSLNPLLELLRIQIAWAHGPDEKS